MAAHDATSVTTRTACCVRSSGEHTYFASDIAYHQDKRERGFERQIDVWGADHHGYVLRMKAAYEALGGDPDELELLIMQLVHLVSSGERAQMSKRAGEFVTLDELVAEIGVDAARWYLLARSHDTTVDLDLDLAREQSNENPVYYVQYAHARIASMLAKAGQRARARPSRPARRRRATGATRRSRCTPTERALIEPLLAFPAELDRGDRAARAAPYRRVRVVLAQAFTAFYRDCQVVGIDDGADGGGGERSTNRCASRCACASARTIARCLGLLGVSAPARCSVSRSARDRTRAAPRRRRSAMALGGRCGAFARAPAPARQQQRDRRQAAPARPPRHQVHSQVEAVGGRQRRAPSGRTARPARA